MLNVSDFSNRLQKVIQYYGESSSSFAEKIGVQRSSISHILSGRNKPSLDFIMKVLHAYPDVELYWLLNGKGDFPKTHSEVLQSTTSTLVDERKENNVETNPEVKQPINESNSEIEKIVIFYKNGTFKSYKP
ncbi:MAG: helix-turn-helix transcriptional regulator [Winogradskyella sp.]|uniref:helix-turn-helix domain-containing protein n=1 Tax=Winogradskyella sp. TaxID=1883156 RepID=UPI0025ECE815|nr:helix-turn-helix transcriptional regulator [Winogradskyella sp.]NRB58905.1 helix-turn-helix transcriptional regulator [Winogradskyella sp.]